MSVKTSDILRWLNEAAGREPIARLCDIRELPRARATDDMRKSLAYSYRSDLDALILDLRRADLSAILGSIIELDGQQVTLPRAGQRDVDELKRIARRAFIHESTRGFHVIEDEDDDYDDEDEDEDDEDEDEDEEDEDEEDEEDEDEDEDEEDEEEEDEEDDEDDEDDDDYHPSDRRRWQRSLEALPRTRSIRLTRVLEAVDLGDVERLRQSRFLELLARLASVSFAIADEEDDIFDDEDESPGVHAKVRLFTEDEIEDEDDVDDEEENEDDDSDHGADELDDGGDGGREDSRANAARSRVHALDFSQVQKLSALVDNRLHSLRDVLGILDTTPLQRLKSARFRALVETLRREGVVLSTPTGLELSERSPSPGIDAVVRLTRRHTSTPVSVIDGRPRPMSPVQEKPKPADYDLARNRLAVLCGVPWVDRERDSHWPTDWTTLALAGTSLPLFQQMTFEKHAAKGLALGTHDIESALAFLREHVAADELTALVDAFESLNGPVGIVARERATYIRRRLGLEAAHSATHTNPTTWHNTPSAPQVPPAAAAASQSPEVNVRSLGALTGIFGPKGPNR